MSGLDKIEYLELMQEIKRVLKIVSAGLLHKYLDRIDFKEEIADINKTLIEKLNVKLVATDAAVVGAYAGEYTYHIADAITKKGMRSIDYLCYIKFLNYQMTGEIYKIEVNWADRSLDDSWKKYNNILTKIYKSKENK